MPSSVTANSESSPVVAPQEMDVSYGSRSVRRASDPGYTRVAVHDREEIEEVDTVINVDDLLRSRQFTSDGAPERSLAGEEYGNRTCSERQDSVRSLTEEVQHIASETSLITRLSLTLLRFLGVGTRWIAKFIRLGVYALCLMPGFIQDLTYFCQQEGTNRDLR